MARLTDLTVKNLPSPTKGQVIHLDDVITGFGVRVSQGGSKTFVLTYGSERRRITLGRYPVITLSQARDAARKHLAERTLGATHSTMPLKELVERFLAEKKATRRPSTHASYKRLLDRHLPKTGSASDMTTRKLTDIFDRLRHVPQERSHLMVVVKILFRYAERHGYIEKNPTTGFQAQISTPKERVLSPVELKAIWLACPDDGFGNSVKLLMLTGQRRGEVAHMQLEDDLVTIESAHTKNKRSHTLPIPPEAAELLSKPLLWGGWSKSKARLDKASKVANWTIHDLRRTYATIHAQIRTPPHIIEALLNHKSGIVSGVASVYNRYQYLDEMRQATLQFSAYMTKITAPGA